MNKSIISILFLLFFVFACANKNKNEQEPANIIPKAKFIKVMTDCRLAESAIRLSMTKGENKEKVTIYFFNQVWKKHEITNHDYNASLEYYSNRPKEMSEIFQKVVTNLSDMQTKVDNE